MPLIVKITTLKVEDSDYSKLRVSSLKLALGWLGLFVKHQFKKISVELALRRWAIWTA
jgi:hypothetical protein